MVYLEFDKVVQDIHRRRDLEKMSGESSNCPFTIFGTCLLLKKTWKVTSCETSGLPQFLEYLIALRVAGKSVPGACMAIDIGARQRSSSGSKLSRNV